MMIENKRFTITQGFGEHHWQIRDNGEIIMDCSIESQAELIVALLNELHEENQSFKEWEKHIGDVKREELDRVFNLSVYEIAEAFNYYENRIKELQDKKMDYPKMMQVVLQ